MAKRNRRAVLDRRAAKKERLAKKEVQAVKFQEERYHSIAPLYAMNEHQREALIAFVDRQLVILSGSAGAGKTELAVWWACKQWLDGNVTNIILTRPDKGHGETYPIPGNDTQKMLPLLYPMLLKIKKYLGVGILKNNLRLEDTEVLFAPSTGIQVVSMAKLGGMSFDNETIVIADEIQAATVAQVKALATRAEEGCQIIITGDTTQTPLNIHANGLTYIEAILQRHPHELADVIKFTPDDCCRHGISAHLTRVFEEEGQW